MVDKEGISADRFIFNYMQEGGDCNTVYVCGATEGEDGPATVDPPHPVPEQELSIIIDTFFLISRPDIVGTALLIGE